MQHYPGNLLNFLYTSSYPDYRIGSIWRIMVRAVYLANRSLLNTIGN